MICISIAYLNRKIFRNGVESRLFVVPSIPLRTSTISVADNPFCFAGARGTAAGFVFSLTWAFRQGRPTEVVAKAGLEVSGALPTLSSSLPFTLVRLGGSRDLGTNFFS